MVIYSTVLDNFEKQTWEPTGCVIRGKRWRNCLSGCVLILQVLICSNVERFWRKLSDSRVAGQIVRKLAFAASGVQNRILET